MYFQTFLTVRTECRRVSIVTVGQLHLGGKNPLVHGMWEVGWDTAEGRRELSGPFVKLNLDSLVICSVQRPLH